MLFKLVKVESLFTCSLRNGSNTEQETFKTRKSGKGIPGRWLVEGKAAGEGDILSGQPSAGGPSAIVAKRACACAAEKADFALPQVRLRNKWFGTSRIDQNGEGASGDAGTVRHFRLQFGLLARSLAPATGPRAVSGASGPPPCPFRAPAQSTAPHGGSEIGRAAQGVLEGVCRA